MTTPYTINDLAICFSDAKLYKGKYVAVEVEMNGYDKNEIIVNEHENIDSKLEYYLNVYDENLEHKHSPGIRIIDFTYFNKFEELEKYFNLKQTLEIFSSLCYIKCGG